MENTPINTDEKPQIKYTKSHPLTPLFVLLMLIGLPMFALWGLSRPWSAESVFERAFGCPPPATVTQLQSETYPALKGCSTFHLSFETDPSTIARLLKPDEYSPTDLENSRVEMLDVNHLPTEFNVRPPLDLQAVKLYRYTGTTRAQQIIAVDKSRSLVVVYIGHGPGCTP